MLLLEFVFENCIPKSNLNICVLNGGIIYEKKFVFNIEHL